MRARWLLVVFASGCQGGSSPVTPDAAIPVDGAVITPDAPSPDAAPIAAIAFDPPSLDFGYVSSVASPLRLTVLNNAHVPIPQFALSLAGDDTADLYLSATTCSSTLDRGGCWIDLTYMPHDGDHTMTITASAPGVLPTTASLHAIGGTEPHPFGTGLLYLDFGVVTVGQTYGQLVRYRNAGTTTLPAASFTFGGESPNQYYLTDDHCTGVQLGPSETCTVVVVYAPTDTHTPGAAILWGTAQDRDELDLRADPGPATTISISPTQYDFGTVGPSPSASVPFTITNTGSVTATGFSTTFYNAQYSASSSTCTSLAPGATCVIDVQLAPYPYSTGPDSGGLDVTAANTGVAGAGFTAIARPQDGVMLDTWTHDFGTAAAGTTGSRYTFTVTNVGTTATSVMLSFDDDAASFTLANDSCSTSSVAAGGTCTFDIVFTPHQPGTPYARVHVTTPYNEAIARLLGDSTPGDQPLNVGPPSYNFSNDTIGMIVIQQFSIVHEGGTAKTVTMSVTGPNASEFQMVNDLCTGTTLNVSGDSCTVDVWYRPATVGTKSATLTADWGAGTSKATLDASAVEDSNPFVNADLPSIDFGAVTVGQSASRTLHFQNYGAATSPPITFLMSGINPGEFSLTNDSCTNAVLSNGDSCAVTVVFAPQSTGTKHADLGVQVRDGGDPKLTGVGQ